MPVLFVQRMTRRRQLLREGGEAAVAAIRMAGSVLQVREEHV